MQQELLRLPAVLTRVGWGRSTLYMKVKNGEFPPPIALGPRARAWISTEVDEWIAQRILETRGAPKSARLDGQPAAVSPEQTT
ncbi:MAG: helix-turn-helix transcriptional regulator [Gammaproteobacteria bacterium]